ncbi:four-carbon acid sugar kinase family protein [soil metagenome]
MDSISDQQIFLSYYGDDFTGSTDVMESLSMNGLQAALFLQPPTLQEVQEFRLKNKAFQEQRKLKAFGVAGVSRSMSTEQMDQFLPDIFSKISKIPSRYFHYKICSTFDSSPEVGNIGHAVELALPHFPSPYIPIVVGAPGLKRYSVFGHLFATADGITYRIDRHPTMARHPVTPMTESDLRLHLGLQTKRKIHLLDVLELDSLREDAACKLKNFYSSNTIDYLLFDVINQEHLIKIGKILYQNIEEKTQIIVGSSGVEYALAEYLQFKNNLQKPLEITTAGEADNLIIMAGSCAPGTQKQIEWVINKGFEGIRINTELLVDPEKQGAEMDRVIESANKILPFHNLVLYSALGPYDSMIGITKQKIKDNFSENGVPGDYLAKLQGIILKRILEKYHKARVVVAGGDTSGQAALALEIYALEILSPIAPGAPLCLAHSKNPLFNGLQIALKGGQNGNEKYFESILLGHQLN